MALILMLDDERDACQLIERVLSSSGHQVRTFTTAQEALQWLQDNTPKLVLLDLKFRGSKGMSVLQYLRQFQPQTQVMLITGNPSTETVRQASELGFDDCLIKPLEINELEERVNRALGLVS